MTGDHLAHAQRRRALRDAMAPGQTEKASLTVGGYGIETVLALKPVRRDFRFVFFDYAGQKNAAAKASCGAARRCCRSCDLCVHRPSLANWPLPQKQAEIQRALAALPETRKLPPNTSVGPRSWRLN